MCKLCEPKLKSGENAKHTFMTFITFKQSKSKRNLNKNSIPVGCVPPAFLVPAGGCVYPWMQTLPGSWSCDLWCMLGSHPPPPPWTEWHTGVNHYLPATSFAGGDYWKALNYSDGKQRKSATENAEVYSWAWWWLYEENSKERLLQGKVSVISVIIVLFEICPEYNE